MALVVLGLMTARVAEARGHTAFGDLSDRLAAAITTAKAECPDRYESGSAALDIANAASGALLASGRLTPGDAAGVAQLETAIEVIREMGAQCADRLAAQVKEKQQRAALAVEMERKAKARCAVARPAEIGMSEAEVRASIWGQPWDEHSLTTAQGTVVEWIYEGGPNCASRGRAPAFLYFKDGALVAIQR